MVASLMRLTDGVRRLNEPDAELAPSETFLGPVEVVGLGRRLFDVELPSGEQVEAELALAFPYEPIIGDTLLALGTSRGGYWIVGVIEGRGNLKMTFQGDVDFHAVGGELSLRGDEGVKITGPSFEVLTESFKTMARTAVQKFDTLQQRVRSLLTVQAREAHTIIEETALHRARKHAVVASETASVNGKQILLG